MTKDTTRTHDWAGWEEAAAAMRTMAGIDFLRGIVDGRFAQAPFVRTLGIRLVEVEQGRAVFEGEPGEFLYNPAGAVHGGYYAALLDSSLGCAVHSTLEAGTVFTTLEYKVNMVRALSADSGLVRSEARIVHRGGRVATAEGDIRDAAGKLCGHGSTTCLIMSVER